MLIKITALFFCAFVFSVSSLANPNYFLMCSAVEDSVKRLACYDDLATAEQKQVDAKAASLLGTNNKKANNWDLSIEQSKIDDSQTVYLMTESITPIQGRFRGNAVPTLILRCMQNVTSAYIDFDGWHMVDISGHGQVTFRIDKEKPFIQGMRPSNDHKGLGFWNGGTSIPFINKLLAGETLLVQATPFRESPLLVTFNISNLKNVIEPLRKACKW